VDLQVCYTKGWSGRRIVKGPRLQVVDQSAALADSPV